MTGSAFLFIMVNVYLWNNKKEAIYDIVAVVFVICQGLMRS